MKNLRQLLAISILMASLSSVALADGGETQGPPLAPPAPPAECTTNCSTSVSSSAATSLATTDLENNAITWLVEVILT